MNSVQLVGNLGRDPEVRFTEGGRAVCNFSVATSSGKDREPDWHRVVVWEKQAEACGQYLRKGSKVAVEGRLTYRTWKDKEGREVTTAEVVAHRVHFLTPRQEQGGGGGDDESAF